jgi:VWFA-related protein
MQIVRDAVLVASLSLSLSLTQAQSPSKSSAVVRYSDSSVPMIKAESREVLVDVTVTDAHGRPVTNLDRRTFHVLEDGKPQAINYFEVHQSAKAAAAVEPLPPLPPNVYTNFVDAPPSSTVNVLLLDALNTPMGDQVYARRQMINYAKALRPGQSIAVFALTSQLRELQGFTTDPNSLLAVLNSKVSNPQKSLLKADGGEDVEMQNQVELLAAANAPQKVIDAFTQFFKDQVSDRLDQRVKLTLDAFQQLSRYLAGVPGKKNLLWFSATFPLGTFADTNASSSADVSSSNREVKDSLRNTVDYSSELRKTADLLAASRIAVYPIDVRGPLMPPVVDASTPPGLTNFSPQSPLRALTNSVNKMQNFQEQTASEHDTMNTVAKESGGHAIYNTNNLQDAIDEVISTGSTYYTLAYTPTNRDIGSKLRHIDVKLDQGHYNLSFRRGYYALGQTQAGSAASQDAAEFFRTAMRKGYPEASQIVFKVRVAPENPQPDAAAPKVGQDTNLKGATTRYQIDLAANIAPVRFEVTPDGVRHGELVIGMVAYGADGGLLNSGTQHISLESSPQEYARMMQTGLAERRELDIPNRQATVRIGVYDPVSGNLGTVEIPLTALPAVHEHGR